MGDRALVIGEQECLVVPDWTSQGSTELIEPKGILRLAGGIREKVGGVHLIVAEELEHRSMPVICAGFRFQIDDTSGYVAEFGRVRSRLDRKLTNRFDGNVE